MSGCGAGFFFAFVWTYCWFLMGCGLCSVVAVGFVWWLVLFGSDGIVLVAVGEGAFAVA